MEPVVRRRPFGSFSFARREMAAAYLFIAPAALGLLVFTFYPMIKAFLISFQDYNLISSSRTFVGWDNYRSILKNEDFWLSLKHSLHFAVFVIPLQTALAFVMALLVRRTFRGSGFFRTVFFIPVVVAIGVACTVFSLIYNKEFGLFNLAMKTLGLPTVAFLSEPSQAMYGVILLCIWKTAGFFMIIFLAGMSNIPESLYEAAEMDGANRWHRFWHITLPLLKRTLGFIVIITTMDAIKVSGPIFILTEGGPAGSTQTIVYYIVKLAFRDMYMGAATAASFILFAIVFTISMIQLRAFRSDVQY